MSKKRILFVCLGNICRSPSAEAVMKAKLHEYGIQDRYFVDSAGITGYHAGEPADSRMREHARIRNYSLTSISRQFDSNTDFDEFDYVIGMDNQNMIDLKNRAHNDSDLARLSKMTDYCTGDFKFNDSVPDPYYGGTAGFENVLDILENACDGLIKVLEDDKS